MFTCKVIESGYVAGHYHEEGEVLTLTERQKECGLRRGRIEVIGAVHGQAGEDDPLGVSELPDDKDHLKQILDKRGIDYRANASVDTLKRLVAENLSE